ncbi:MAG: hypothetical protein QOH16_697 [Gaiellaceae bacterium]|nr:hypothetical protein [Gaiellaceae bacterium]
MEIMRRFVYPLENREQLREHVDDPGFDVRAYSLMKHGGWRHTQSYGRRMFDELEQDPQVRKRFYGPAPPLFFVAWASVRPTCFNLTRVVADEVNTRRRTRGLPLAPIVKITKDRVTAANYAAASRAERAADLATIAFELPNVDLRQRCAIVLDDIRVTGLAESVVIGLFENTEIAHLLLAYLVLVDPLLASADPQIEDVINQYAVASPLDMLDSIHRDDFVLTVRFVKFLLRSDASVIAQFVAGGGHDVAAGVLDAAHATGRDFVEAHRQGVGAIREALISQHASRPSS